eukprot:gene13-658_t
MSWADEPVKRSWADEDEELELENKFETAVDKDGIKEVTTYEERGGNSYKIVTRVKVEEVRRRVNTAVKKREGLPKFGKAASGPEDTSSRSPEDVPIEATKRLWGVQQDEMDKFFEQEAEVAIAGRRKEGIGAWKSRRDDDDMPAMDPGGKFATDADNRDAGGRYVPPSLRKGGGKGGGKGDDEEQHTLRVFNLSQDVREGDIHELFGPFGQLQRVFVAKDQETGLCKGFAFVTFYRRNEAERAIEKLNGHGYDNLILNVSFAKPRNN